MRLVLIFLQIFFWIIPLQVESIYWTLDYILFIQVISINLFKTAFAGDVEVQYLSSYNLRWFPSLYSLLNNLILLFLIIFFRITTIRWFKSRSVLFLFSLFIFFSINFSLSLLLLLLCSQTNFHSNLKLGENDDDIWIWFSVTIILNFFLLNFSCNSVHVFAVALHISLRACSLLTPLEGDSITQLVAENISCDLSLTFLISLPRSRISWASSGWHVNSFIPTTFHHSLFQKNKTQHSL